jgi:uncharacterized protein YjbJ (UPF0337 family)
MCVAVPTTGNFAGTIYDKHWKSTFHASVMTIGSWLTYQETLMNKDQVKGRIEEAKGKVKEATGVVLDDKDLEAEGNVQKNIGKVRSGFGDLKEDLKDSI